MFDHGLPRVRAGLDARRRSAEHMSTCISVPVSDDAATAGAQRQRPGPVGNDLLCAYPPNRALELCRAEEWIGEQRTVWEHRLANLSMAIRQVGGCLHR